MLDLTETTSKHRHLVYLFQIIHPTVDANVDITYKHTDITFDSEPQVTNCDFTQERTSIYDLLKNSIIRLFISTIDIGFGHKKKLIQRVLEHFFIIRGQLVRACPF
jgi:hypothetical protein